MFRDLRNLRVLVTGASSGIGLAFVKQAAKLGAKLVLAARSEDKLHAIAASLGVPADDVLVVPTDVTSEADRQNALDRAVDHFGGLDVLVNNAGISSWAHFADSTEEVMRRIMEVNFFAPTELIRQAIPILVNGRQPAVLNVASMCGRKAMPAWSEYSASKHALCGLTEALRGELARFDIDVLLMVPGLTNSDLPQHLLRSDGKEKIDFEGGMSPDVVAAAMVRSLQRNRTETVVGSDAKWMLRANRWFPRLTDWLIARRVKKLYATQG